MHSVRSQANIVRLTEYRISISLKSELPKVNHASLDLIDILFTDALTAAEYEFYDTIRIKIGFEKGTNFSLRLTTRPWNIRKGRVKETFQILWTSNLYALTLHDSYNTMASKTWGTDEKSLTADFPSIRAELTPSKTLTRTDNQMFYSCRGDNITFLKDDFQNAKRNCENGIRSFINEAGIGFIETTPGIHQSWWWLI